MKHLNQLTYFTVMKKTLSVLHIQNPFEYARMHSWNMSTINTDPCNRKLIARDMEPSKTEKSLKAY